MQLEKYNHPWLFYTLATLGPWLFWFGAGWLSWQTPGSEWQMPLVTLLGLLGLFFPMALSLALIARQPSLRADVRARLFGLPSVSQRYVLLAVGLMPASILLAQAFSLPLGYSTSQFNLSGRTSFTAGLLPGWFMIVLAPLVEELAWHSYGTDCLRQRMNLLNTSLLFAFFWALWHTPLAGINGYYQANVAQQGWIYSANFAVSLIPFTLLMNWLYYKSNRNIALAVLFHITAGAANEAFQTHPDSKIIQTGLLSMLVLWLMWRDPGFFLDRSLSGAPSQWRSSLVPDGRS